MFSILRLYRWHIFIGIAQIFKWVKILGESPRKTTTFFHCFKFSHCDDVESFDKGFLMKVVKRRQIEGRGLSQIRLKCFPASTVTWQVIFNKCLIAFIGLKKMWCWYFNRTCSMRRKHFTVTVSTEINQQDWSRLRGSCLLRAVSQPVKLGERGGRDTPGSTRTPPPPPVLVHSKKAKKKNQDPLEHCGSMKSLYIVP